MLFMWSELLAFWLLAGGPLAVLGGEEFTLILLLLPRPMVADTMFLKRDLVKILASASCGRMGYWYLRV